MLKENVNEKIQDVNTEKWEQFIADVEEYKQLPANQNRADGIQLSVDLFKMLMEGGMRFPGLDENHF